MPEAITRLLRMLSQEDNKFDVSSPISLLQLLEAIVEKMEEPRRLKAQRNRLRAELETLERDMKAKNILV